MLRLFLSAALLAAGTVCSAPLQASSVIVPDDFATVQSAIDSAADTVKIRGGRYKESLVTIRGVVLEGLGAGRPLLDGLAIFNHTQFASTRWKVNEIDFTGPIEITTDRVHPRLLDVRIMNSRAAGGLRHLVSLDPADIEHLSVIDSYLGANSNARALVVFMESDTVAGSMSLAVEEQLTVQSSRFLGGAGRALDILGDAVNGTVAFNRVEPGYTHGMFSRGLANFSFVGNTILGASSRGLCFASSEVVTVSDNNIQDCGFGIAAEAEFLTLQDNTVLRSVRDGMELYSLHEMIVTRNVVGGGSGAGIVVASTQEDLTRVASNTVFGNEEAGFEFGGGFDGPGTVENNIGYGNGTFGLVVLGSSSLTLHCNDWYANQSGPVSGISQGASDLNVNPRFCNVAEFDVTLFDDSPLLDASECGLIGALGLGCGTTQTVLQRFEARLVEDRVVVRWQFDPLSVPGQMWLERSTGGTWRVVPDNTSMKDGTYVQFDRDVEFGATYSYRLGWEEEGTTMYSAAVEVRVPAERISPRVMPNPSYGPIRIQWSLEQQERVQVRIHDVTGREVASFGPLVFPRGPHSITWEGFMRNGRRAPAGWYSVHISGRATTRTTFLLLR